MPGSALRVAHLEHKRLRAAYFHAVDNVCDLHG
jgi:hypothetical protein